MLGGLYIVKGPASKLSSPSHQACVVTPLVFLDSALWHFRLGHVFVFRLKLLTEMYPYIPQCNTKHICDICHFSRQKKLSFSLSTSHAKHPFDLVHLDLWDLTKHLHFINIDIFSLFWMILAGTFGLFFLNIKQKPNNVWRILLKWYRTNITLL
jgi:hypothetical protein